jgi:hypothetical protein
MRIRRDEVLENLRYYCSRLLTTRKHLRKARDIYMRDKEKSVPELEYVVDDLEHICCFINDLILDIQPFDRDLPPKVGEQKKKVNYPPLSVWG